MKFVIPFDHCVSKRDKIVAKKWGAPVTTTNRYKNALRDIHLITLTQAREVGFKPIPEERGVRVDFVIHFPSGKQKDMHNYTEAIFDALEDVAYANDSQVIETSALLAGYDKENPRITVSVNETNRERPLPPSRQPKSRRQPKEQ